MRKLGLGLGGIVLVLFGWFLHGVFPWSRQNTGSLGDDNQPITIADGSVDVKTHGPVGKHPVMYANTYVKSIHLSANPTTYHCDPDSPGSGQKACIKVDHVSDTDATKTGSVQLCNFDHRFLFWGWTAVSVMFDPTLDGGWSDHSRSGTGGDNERHLDGYKVTGVEINGTSQTCGNASVKCAVTVCLSTTLGNPNCP